MKKTLKIFILFPLMLCFSLGITACSNGESNVSSYVISATFDDSQKTLSANMQVSYYNNSETELKCVKFHLYPNAYRQTASLSAVSDLEIDEAYPNGISYGDITVQSVRDGTRMVDILVEGEDSNILTVPLASTLKPGQRTQIGMTFTVKLANVKHRLGFFGKTINLGNWYPIACKFENGEFDVTPYYYIGDPFFSDVSDYDITITAPMKYSVAASGDTVSSVPNTETETTTTTLSSKKMRDFAIILGEYSVASEMVGKTKINYYYYDDLNVEKNMTTAVDALKTFNEMFGDYPYITLSVAKTGFLMGGMEYPGLVFISDSLGQSRYTETIVHEIAHQWWGCVVGNNQTHDAWLDEGLAEYATTMFYEANPSYNVTLRQRMADSLSGFMLYIDLYKHNGKGDTSMNRKLNEYSGQMEYMHLVYNQGQIMFDAVRNLTGDDAFNAALSNYYKNYKFAIASPDSLIGEFEKTSKREFKSFFDSWVEGNVEAYN